MVYRRKRIFKKKRTFKRRFSKRYRKPKAGIHLFKRTMVATMDITDDNYQALYPYTAAHNSYSLAQLPSYSEFTSLYDSYKICGIKTKFIYDHNASENSTGEGIPTLASVNDFNDSTVMTEATMMQYPSFKTTRLNRPITRYFRPCQAVSGTNQIVKSRWNPTDAYQTVHFGLKAAVIGSNSSPASADIGRLKIYTTFYLAFRTPK